MKDKKMDLLVLNYNDAATTKEFVNSVKDYSCVKRILIVDNCSTDNSYELLKKLSTEKIVVLRTDRNGGYGYGNNYGINYLHVNYDSDYILLSNPDVIVEEKVLIELEKFLINNKDYAIAAPLELNPSGEKCWNAAFKIPSKWDFILSTNWIYQLLYKPLFYKEVRNDDESTMDVDALAGSLFLMNVENILESGLFDEDIFLYWEEIVLGIRIKSVHRKAALVKNVSYVHNHSVSISKTYKSAIAKQKLFIKSKLYVLKKYYHANFIEYLFAYCLAKLSLIDEVLLPRMRFVWRRIRGK